MLASLVTLVQSPETWLTFSVGIIISLVSVIFHSMTTRVKSLEENMAKISPAIASININISEIKKHCSHCMDGK